MVTSEKVLEELNLNHNFKRWYGEAKGRRLAINTTAEEDNELDILTENLIQQGNCVSNDYHILALAKLTGARLLYTQDRKLISDFKGIIKGKVYPSGNSKKAKKDRNRIHNEKNLCATRPPA